MGRILAIDFGKKRTGIAVTDPLQIIATGLETVESKELIGYLKKYFASEEVDKVLIGYPLNWDDSPTDATPLVDKFIKQFQHVFPNMPFDKQDERFTSKMATEAMLQMGLKKKDRANKGLIDEISATIILQEYLQSKI
jgi:putative Holliday junction resolvase